MCVFHVSGLWKKITWNGLNKGQEVFVPTNQDLANILGGMKFYFDNLYFCFFCILNFQIPGFLDSWISRRRRRRRRTNSQITWPLFERSQGSNTLQGALAAIKWILDHFRKEAGTVAQKVEAAGLSIQMMICLSLALWMVSTVNISL